MCEYVTADEGYEWVLTETGKAVDRIAAKYDKNRPNNLQYSRKVPVAWFNQGLVKQVKKA